MFANLKFGISIWHIIILFVNYSDHKNHLRSYPNTWQLIVINKVNFRHNESAIIGKPYLKGKPNRNGDIIILNCIS